MNDRMIIRTILIVWGLSLLYCGVSFSDDKSDLNILEKLREVQHSSWEEKEKVIRTIQGSSLKLSEAEKNAIIDMFEKESKFQQEYINNLRKQGSSLNQAYDKFHELYDKKGYSDYFINFARLVSSFKDARTIPGLLRGLNYYGGAIVPTHVISMGNGAIKPLLSILSSKDKDLRKSAFFVLSIWANAPIVTEDYSITDALAIRDAELLGQIKALFLDALQDEDMDVRARAVFGLRAFPEDIVIQKLNAVVKNDPYSYFSKYEKKLKYPIREDAKKTIEIIGKKMKRNINEKAK